MSGNELVTTNYQVAPITELSQDDLADILNIRYDRVRFPGAGGLAFEIPTGDPDNPDTAREIEGVIIHSHATSAVWFSSSPDGSEPDLRSDDGITQAVTPEVIEKTKTLNLPAPHADLATDPYHQWGSGPLVGRSPRGKAATEKRRLYIVRSGEILPIILDLPAMSIAPFTDYRLKRVVMKQLNLAGVVTRIGLERAKSGNGEHFSRAVFTLAGVLDPTAAAQMVASGEALKQHLNRIPVEPVVAASGVGTPEVVSEFETAFDATETASDFDAPEVI